MTPWAPHRGSLITIIPHTGQNFQCSTRLPQNKRKWEKYGEDTLAIARMATLIQKRSGGLTSRGQALLESREQILAKNMRAGAEALIEFYGKSVLHWKF